MSKATELAEAEAARAEAEEPDEEEAGEEEPAEPPAEPETETEAAEPPLPEGALSAEQLGELDKAQTLYEKRVHRILGKDNAPPPCPRCAGTGFDFQGESPRPVLKVHDKFHGCVDCDGFGYVLTGSKRPELEQAECPTCQGRGFVEKLYDVRPPVIDEAQYGTPSWMGNAQAPTAPIVGSFPTSRP